MTFELRSNGNLEIELRAETAIEEAFLVTIGAGAAKGQPVKVLPCTPKSGRAALIVSVER
jgi:hypothetical protein